MEVLVQVAQLFLSLTILVFIHELGHFLTARWFKMRVDKFYVFMDFLFPFPNLLPFSIFKKKVGDTEYGIGWFPLGGYVQINGMVDETMDTEKLKEPPKPYEFRSKPAWQRLIVMLGGVIFNVVLGILLFTMITGVYEKQYLSFDEGNKYGVATTQLGKEYGFQDGDKVVTVNGKIPKRFKEVEGTSIVFGGEIEVERAGQKKTISIPNDHYKAGGNLFSPFYESITAGQISINSNAERAGLEEGDKFLSINGKAIQNSAMFINSITANKGNQIALQVERAGKVVQLSAQVDTAGKMGFGYAPSTDDNKYQYTQYNLGEMFTYGTKAAINVVTLNAVGLARTVSGKINARDSIASPIRIATIFPKTWDWGRFWVLTAMLSMVLAFMNLLPIPALDGGHVVFLLWEMVTGKAASVKVLTYAQVVGLVLVGLLMLFAFGNDILYLLGK